VDDGGPPATQHRWHGACDGAELPCGPSGVIQTVEEIDLRVVAWDLGARGVL